MNYRQKLADLEELRKSLIKKDLWGSCKVSLFYLHKNELNGNIVSIEDDNVN